MYDMNTENNSQRRIKFEGDNNVLLKLGKYLKDIFIFPLKHNT